MSTVKIPADLFAKLAALFMFLALLVPLVISISQGFVSVYVPFVSECGAKFPAYAAFVFYLMLTGACCIVLNGIRFLELEMLSKEEGVPISKTNYTAWKFGWLYVFGMWLAGVIPVTESPPVHFFGAALLFLFALVWVRYQNAMDYEMDPHQSHQLFLHRLRKTLYWITTYMILLIVVFGTIGYSLYDHGGTMWTGNKTPNEYGFVFLLVAAFAEWIPCVNFVSYFLTLVPELKGFTLNVSLERNAVSTACNNSNNNNEMSNEKELKVKSS